MGFLQWKAGLSCQLLKTRQTLDGFCSTLLLFKGVHTHEPRELEIELRKETREPKCFLK
jgi:sirohydrochlorin ferrochelatase